MIDQHGEVVPHHLVGHLWPQRQKDGTVCLVIPDHISQGNIRDKRYAQSLKIPVKYKEQ